MVTKHRESSADWSRARRGPCHSSAQGHQRPHIAADIVDIGVGNEPVIGWIPASALEDRLRGILPFYGSRPRLRTNLVIEHDDLDINAAHNTVARANNPSSSPDWQSGGRSWARLVEEARTWGDSSDGGATVARPRSAVTADHQRRVKDTAGAGFGVRDGERSARAQPVSREWWEQHGPREQHEQRERERPSGFRTDCLRRPDELAIQGHVCRSRIPRPCKYGPRCRDPHSCDYCHDDAHSGKRMAKAWLQELHEDAAFSSSDGVALAPREPPAPLTSTARPAVQRVRKSDKGMGNEYAGRFFPQSISAEEEESWPPCPAGNISDGEEADEDDSDARPPPAEAAPLRRAGAEPRRVSFADQDDDSHFDQYLD